MVQLTRREASIITSKEVRALQKATPAQLAQAESLIIRGKAGAVRGDPILQPIVNALAALGVQSVASQRFKAEALARQRAEQEKIVQDRIRAEEGLPPTPSRVEAVERPKGVFAGKLFDVQKRLSILETAKRREAGKFNARREVEIAKLSAQQFALETGLGIAAIPSFVTSLAKDPSQLKKVPAGIKDIAVEQGQLLQTSPTTFFISLAGEIFLLKGTGKVLKLVGKVTGRARAVLSPKFKKVKFSKIEIPSPKKGKPLVIKIGAPLKKLAEPTAKQIRLAGKEVTAVSAQADRLVTILKKQKIVRKPIPNEANLSPLTKKLLKRFDRRTITSKQLAQLELRIRREARTSLLERSLFADPRGRLRPSRLGLDTPDASLLDILRGDFVFRTSKPQVLVFQKALVEKFPKTKIFKSIKKKLKTKNPVFTKAETEAFLRFQLKVSGKFKPIGALSTEPEITLPAGSIVKKGKTLAVTIIQGRRIPIVSAKVVRARPRTATLLKKSRTGGLTSKELRELKTRLKRETGFKPSVSRARGGRPVIRSRPFPRITRRKRVTSVRRGLTRVDPRRITPKRRITAAQRKVMLRNLARARAIRAGRIARPVTRVGRPGRPPRRVVRPGVVRVVPLPRIKKRIKKKPVRKPQPSFSVFAKSKGKFVKLNTRPLSKTDAKKLGSRAVDSTLARTFKIKATGKKELGKTRGTFKKQKFRSFKRVKGRKKLLKDTFIEKRRFIQDHKGEKKGLTIARFLAQERRRGVTRPKSRGKTFVRRSSPSQFIQNQRLKNLRKARKVLASNRRKRR